MNKFFYTRIRRKTINGMVRYQAQYKKASFFSFLSKWRTIKFGNGGFQSNGAPIIVDWTVQLNQAKTGIFMQMKAEGGIEIKVLQRWEKHNKK